MPGKSSGSRTAELLPGETAASPRPRFDYHFWLVQNYQFLHSAIGGLS
jgi:hypothetical protein